MNRIQLNFSKSDFKSTTKNHLPFKKILITVFTTVALSACISNTSTQQKNKAPQPSYSKNQQQNTPDAAKYICHQPSKDLGQVVGDGQCVSFIKQCSSAPRTHLWTPGKKVLSLPEGAIKPGSIIATFKNNKYPNVTGYHAAIYIEHNENGIWVWDQWIGKPVHKRFIRTRHDNATASNTAQAYRLVQ